MGPWRSRPGLGLCPPLVPATHWICTARASSRGWRRGSDCHSGSRGARGARGSRQRTAPVARTCARRPTLPPAACGGDPQGRRPRRTLGTRQRRGAGPRASPAGQLPLPFPSSGRPRDLTRRRAGGDAPLPSCSQTCRLPGPAKAQALGRLTLTGTVRLGDPVRLPQSQAHLATRRTGRTPPVCLPCKLPSGSEEQLPGLALCVHLEPVSASAGVFRRRVRSRGQTTLRVHTMTTVMLRGPWLPKEWRASRRSGLGGRDCSYPSQLSSHIDVVKKKKKRCKQIDRCSRRTRGVQDPVAGPA